jgi:opacity protein-like surface antigen
MWAGLFGVGLSQAALAAETGPYLGGTVGLTTSGDLELTDGTLEGRPVADASLELEDGYSAHLAGGYDFGPVRAELELGYFNTEVGSVINGGRDLAMAGVWQHADFEATSYMVNAIGDLPVYDRFSLFGGVGMGWAEMNIESNEEGDIKFDAEAVAYQLLAGVGYQLGEHLEFAAQYRLWSTLDGTFDIATGWESGHGDIEMPLFHSFELGLRYTF